MRPTPSLLLAALAVTLATSGCGRAAEATPVLLPNVAALANFGASALEAGEFARAQLDQDPAPAAAGLPPALAARAERDANDRLTPAGQRAVFNAVWQAMLDTSRTANEAPTPGLEPPAPAATDGPSGYTVLHYATQRPTHAEIFVDAAEILPAVMETLAGAQRSIHMDLFLLGGTEGQKVAELLVAKAQAGVEVHILHDPGFGLSGVAREEVWPVMRYLQSHGVAVKPYPLAQMPRRGGNPWANRFQIDHDKFLVVDGTTAMIGSMNLIDIGVMNHDLYMRLSGDVASELEAIHAASWNLKGPKAPNFQTVAPKPKQVLEVAGEAGGESRARVVKTDIDMQITKQAIIDDIAHATKSVHVAIYEFGDMDIVKALIDAHRRGLDVRVLADRNANYAKYLSVFKHLDLYGTPNLRSMNALRAANVPVKWFRPQTSDQELHMKTVVCDGETAIVGSTNFTSQALTTFRETSVEVTGPVVAPRIEATFEHDWVTMADPVKPPTFYERVIIAAVAAMDRFNLSWW